MYMKLFDVSSDNLYDGQGVQPVPATCALICGKDLVFLVNNRQCLKKKG